MMRRMVSLALALVAGVLLTAPTFAQTVLFGPQTYTRTAGAPNAFTDPFTLPIGTTAPYTLHIVNGQPDGTKRVSSATIKLNGTEILSPSDFNQNVAVLDRTVTLQSANSLTVQLTSAPGSRLTVSVLATSAGAQPTALTPNPLTLAAGATGTLTATLAPAPTGAGTVAVNSADPAVATAPASVAFSAGQTSVPVPITAVAAGSTTVTVTLNGASAASQVTVTPPPPAITSVTPTSGLVGDIVTLTGTQFINVQTVAFNGVAALFTIDHATTITAVVPSGVTTGPITVTGPGGTAQSATAFTLLHPVPVLTAVSPTIVPSGSPATTLTVTGLSFVPGATVTFGSTVLVTTYISATSLTAVIPVTLLTTKGTVSVTVSNPAPGGGVSNSLPVLIANRPPQLAPIGNQTVPLGSTLTFTATASDPDHDPVSFAATPLPLPAHATFHTETGLFVFTPDATQVGTFPLTLLATDGFVTTSESITITVTGAPAGGVTGVSGRVVDGAGQPIANLPVSVKGTTASTTTDAQGQFTLNTLTVTGRQVLLANGFALGYAILAAPVDLIPNVMNSLASELRVPALDLASAVTVNPNATTVLGNPAFPAVSVTIPPHTAKNPDGTEYTGVLTISPVPEYGRPESRPVELKPGFSITIQPAGITMATPAPITLPNTDNLPVGNEFDLWSLSPDTGTFSVAGRMKVSADGSKLETISGGVRKTAWHFALAPAASTPPAQNRIIGGCTECAVASSGDLTEGTLTQAVVIPGVRTLGVSRDLMLQYNSTTADVQPILPITATLSHQAAVPPTFSADLTVGGLKQGTRGYWNASVMNENATSSTRMGIAYDAAPLPTGRYPFELVTYSNYGQSSIGAISNGHTVIRNEQASSYGAGWNLNGVDRLIVPPAGDLALLAKGNGQTMPYVSASIAGLSSWWPAEGTAVDGNSVNNGTLLNGVTFTAGQMGQAFTLDGVDDYIRVPHHANLDPGAGSFTVEAWIQSTVSVGALAIVSKQECSGNICPGGSVYVLQLRDGRPYAVVRDADASGPNGPAGFRLAGTRAIADGDWHHVALVRDMTAGFLRWYVDGQVDVSAPLDPAMDGAIHDQDGEPDPLTIGAQINSGATPFPGSYFPGKIDEVEVYRRALSPTEVQAIFASGGRRSLSDEFLPPPSESASLKKNPDGTYTRTLKDGTTYQFSAQGYQTAMADRNGNTTTYAYNASNQLTTITDPAGQVTTLSYSGNKLGTITDPAGRVTTLTHDSAGNLIAVEAPDQTRTTFQYDAQHRMVQKRDGNGQASAYQFDHAGRLKQATLPNGDRREIRPTELTGVPNLAAGDGTPTTPSALSQPPIIQATFKDAKGQTTIFETDAIGRVTKQIDPLTRTTTIQRDPQGNPITITRPNGAITTMTYDAKGNLLTSTESSIAATTTFVYEPVFNQVTRITDPKGNQTNITYDAKGNPLTITDANNQVTTFTYDSRGLLLTTKDALNQTTTFTYDTLGRLLTTTDPLNRTTTLTYDQAGNVATSKDALDRITSFQYDAKNRLTTVIDPLLGETVYTYDANGNLLTVKDAKTQTTTFAYDSRNRLISTTDPLGKVETYEYDGNDNLTKRITPKLDQILFAYDPVNQLLSKTLPGNQVTSYTYSPVGNLLTVTDPDSALTMTYDPANRLLTTSTAGSPNQPSVTLSYAYDKNGNRLTLNGGTASHTYVYDVLNRLTSVTSPAGAATLAYDALSRRTAMTLPNGTNTSYTYDVASQITNILHKNTATNTPINNADYLYNNVGNRTQLTDRKGVQAFGYDNLDRLTSATHPLPPTSQTFAYDAVGNRTSNGSLANTGNQLTENAQFIFEYDDNGNQTKKTSKATNNFTIYTHDAENRLIQVQDFVAGNPTAVATSTYRYDGLGRRIEKIGNGQTRRYVYERDQILLEYDGANVLQARYTYGPRMDEPIAVTRGANTFFYHADGLNSVTDLTDSSGATVQGYAYDAWGNVVEQTGSVENPFVFTGRERDSETSLYYYRARYYEPLIGRFIQKDPIGGDQGKNLYPYVQNNPVNRIDPSGKVDISACSYYDKLCATSGGQCRYYCKASTLCQNAPYLPFLWGASASQISCIRGMLIDYDKLFQKDKSNSNICPDCLKDSVIDDYHRAAYSQCGVEPWLYPGLRPFGLDFRMGNDRN